MNVELLVFVVAGAAVLTGAVGVIATSNPVHSALMLVMTLFGVAVLFVAQDAQFLAAVQVIVYAGAIVVLFLFVIMLLGVQRSENLRTEPLVGQRVLALLAGAGLLAVLLTAIIGTSESAEMVATGYRSVAGPLSGTATNIGALGRSLFTDYLYAFEITSVLLVIAVVAAVVLTRKVPAAMAADDEAGDPDGDSGAGAGAGGSAARSSGTTIGGSA